MMPKNIKLNSAFLPKCTIGVQIMQLNQQIKTALAARLKRDMHIVRGFSRSITQCTFTQTH
jgi:hypothetical protein